jgi:hypothetical protein
VAVCKIDCSDAISRPINIVQEGNKMNAELLERLVRTAFQVGGSLFATASWYSDSRWGLITGVAVTVVSTAWTVYVGWNAAPAKKA